MISRSDYARVIAAERVLVDALKRIAAMACGEHGDDSIECAVDECGVAVARDALATAYPSLSQPSQTPKPKRRSTAHP